MNSADTVHRSLWMLQQVPLFFKESMSKVAESQLPIATVKQNSRPLFNFEADVDWHQRHEFLKCKCRVFSMHEKVSRRIVFSVELPLNIHSPYATYETQFGFVQRPTHKNTTWDIAKVSSHI